LFRRGPFKLEKQSAQKAKEQGATQQEAIAQQIGNFKKAFDLKGEYHFSGLTSKVTAK
jgi:hypothetical protein